jgi:hypothetical protein
MYYNIVMQLWCYPYKDKIKAAHIVTTARKHLIIIFNPLLLDHNYAHFV